MAGQRVVPVKAGQPHTHSRRTAGSPRDPQGCPHRRAQADAGRARPRCLCARTGSGSQDPYGRRLQQDAVHGEVPKAAGVSDGLRA